MKDIYKLKKLILFSTIPIEDKTELLSNITIQSYSKGETVYNHGDECKRLDIVISGSLVAYSLTENGSSTVMFQFQKQSIIGANLLFSENNIYPLNIFCLSDCQLVHIDKNIVAELLHDYDFVMEYIKSLSQNSQGLNQKIALFSRKTLRENIIDYLNNQANMQKSNKIVLPVSKKELADYFGVERPSLFRELKKMKDEKLIEIQNKIIILNQNIMKL